MKCQRDLSPARFGSKPNGTPKQWCKRCCNRQSKRAKRFAPRIKIKYSGLNYKSRRKVLKRLGFKSYQAYLASPLWRSVREQVYALKGDRCTICGSPATELHHNRYHRKDLLGLTLDNIHPLCRECHEEIEFDNGHKSTLDQAAKAFAELADLASVNRDDGPNSREVIPE
jgi:rRNA maturation protein Nop10